MPDKIEKKPMPKILLVDDEPDIIELIQYHLEKEGYLVKTAKNGVEGLKVAKSFVPDLILLDVMMPEMDGIEACIELRKDNTLNSTLIAFLTARAEDYSHVAGLDSGADDYITKPFDSELLIHKINALLRRKLTLTLEDKSYSIGSFTYDSKFRTLIRKDESRKLSPKESKLLQLFCEHINDILPRDKALKMIWKNNNYFTKRSMDVYITKLRKYLAEDSRIEIVNIHSNGYMLKTFK